MNDLQSVREHVQLVIDDAEQNAELIDTQPIHVMPKDHLRYVYADIQGLGKMMLEVIDHLESSIQKTEFGWVRQIKTVDAEDAVEAMMDNSDWQLLHVGTGKGGQTTLTFGGGWDDQFESRSEIMKEDADVV